MDARLVLEIFPGISIFGLGFERAGFCVVRGPDVIFGGDVRDFHPPVGVFDGVIGGDPCQSHSVLANLVRAKGLEPSFPDMTPEVQRIVEEARPRWFLRENVPNAPDVKPAGYDVRSFLLDHSTLDSGDGTGHEQMRKRRFWFGVREPSMGLRDKTAPKWKGCPELRQFIDFALFVLPDRAVAVGNRNDYIDGAEPIGRHRKNAILHAPVEATREREQTVRARRQAVTHKSDPIPVKLGGSGKVKVTRMQAVTARHDGEIGATGGHKGNAPRYSLAEMLELQGLPVDFLDRAPWTMQGKRKAIGNAVALPMAIALGRAVALAMAPTPEPGE